ncbi:MAG: AAA family ATPase [Ruegeria sp.]
MDREPQMKDIAAFLDGLGLARYTPLFEAAEVELSDLPELSEADLQDMGLPLGPRRRILKAQRERAAPPLMPHGAQGDGANRPGKAGKIEAERRQLTVMFVDLVGSTPLSMRLDPEDLGELVRRFKETCTTAVGRFGGHVASFMGDGAMIYFGYPHAHEDAAARAIHAGLEILGALPDIDSDEPLRARIGISTGLVVVGTIHGEGLKENDVVMGETPNLAARLQALAEPNTLVIGAPTRKLVGNAFELEDMGQFTLKGFSNKVPAWTVIGPARNERRFGVMLDTGSDRLVGRWAEFEHLQEKWRAAQSGAGQVVLVSGEAGIGKSRLAEGLSQETRADGRIRLSFQCSPYHSNSALYPLIQHLEGASKFTQSDSADERLAKLEDLMQLDADQDMCLIADLLHLPTENRFGPLDLTPQQRLERTFQVMSEQLIRMAADDPVLVLFEDVHWIDPTTHALLQQMVERVRDLPVLIVMTTRPGFDPGWGPRANVSDLQLGRLSSRHIAEIVTEVAGKPLPEAVCDLIAAKADGIPLYVQEVTRGLLESGQLRDTGDTFVPIGPLPELSVPNTLRDSLMERLDRLGMAKEVAQTGAVFGRHFTFALLTSVSMLAPSTLRAGLDQLVSAGIILQRGMVSAEGYVFRHALLRDMAYDSLLRTERQVLHERAAGALHDQQPHLSQTQPEVLAHHYTMANRPDEAVHHWQSAGRQAVERSANTEAVTHLSRALDLLAKQPRTERRDRQEIEIQVLRAGVLRSTVGIAADDTGDAYARLRKLCGRIGELQQLFPVLNGLYAFHLVRAEYRLAHEVAAQILELADRTGKTEHRMVGHRAMGAVQLHIGHLPDARGHLEQALALYDPDEHGHLAYVYGTDHAAITAAFLGKCYCVMGLPERALEVQTHALEGAERLKHAHSVAQVLTYMCMVHLLRRDFPAALETADRLARLSDEHSFSFMATTARFWRSWAQATLFPDAQRISELRAAAEEWWASGAGNYKPFFRTLLAEHLLTAGGVQAAAKALEQASFHIVETEEGWARAEQLRVQALLARERGEDPVPLLKQAMAAAREHGADLFELRAAVALARLQKERGVAVEPTLQPVLDRIGQNAELADVTEARALFETIS